VKPEVEILVTDALTADKSVVEVDMPGGKAVEEERLLLLSEGDSERKTEMLSLLRGT
jgi:hypothetical protein